jgi:alkaline phosphatase D
MERHLYQDIYSDADIFLLDDRTWRSNDNLSDSVDGKPNPIKKMFGDQQIDWLKNSLAEVLQHLK